MTQPARVSGVARLSAVSRSLGSFSRISIPAPAGKVDVARLGVLLRKDLRANVSFFWDALKQAAEERYGDTEAAFRAHSCPKDGLMSSAQFLELCEASSILVDNRILRNLFEMKLWGVVYTWSIHDYQEMLLAAKIDRTRARLEVYNTTRRRVMKQIDKFVRHMALDSGEVNKRRAVTRFQRKLTLDFCREFWEGLKKICARRLAVWEEPSTEIDREECLAAVTTAGTFLGYEINLFNNLFDRIDRSPSRRGRVNMWDLSVALALLGTESSREEKMRFIFCVFDTDNDGCLTSEQILRMYCSITIHAVIARGDQPSYDADIVLGDELSLSKARRLYDFTLQQFSHEGVLDLCTFEELWGIFRSRDFLLDELIPGIHSIAWVTRPLGPVKPSDKAVTETPATALLRRRTDPEGDDRERGIPRSLIQKAKTMNEGAERFLSRKSTIDVGRRLTRKSTLDALPRRSGVERKTGDKSSLRACASLPQLRSFDSTERFRKHAAVRFRHAVRGEWDLIDALQQGRPPSQGLGDSSGLQLLPAIGGVSTSSFFDHSTLSIADMPDKKIEVHASSSLLSGSAAKTPLGDKKADLWSEAMQGLDRRQKQNSWVDSHRKTISNWSRAGLSPCADEDFYPLRTTDPGEPGRLCSLPRAVPEPLPRKAADRSKSDAVDKDESSGARRSASTSVLPPTSLSTDQMAAKNAKKMAEVVMEHSSAMRAMPDLNQRFGDASVRLFKAMSQGQSSEKPKARGDRDPPAPSQTIKYNCQLCRGCHGVTVPCSI